MAVSEQKWQDSMKTTVTLLVILLAALTSAAAFLIWIFSVREVFWYRLIGILLITGLLCMTVVTFTGMVAFYRLWYNKAIPYRLLMMIHFSLQWLYPVLIFMGSVLHKDKNEIRRAYTRLNNQALMGNKKKYRPDEVLILVPHCIQQSECEVKITNRIDLCRECGLCNIADFISLKKQYGVNTVVVTGGTLARKRIQDNKPRLIIAVACERDLISGMMDVRDIPVYAVINERPEGPCHNTKVNMEELEQILNLLLLER
jgi:uncharacterized protein